MNLVVLSQFLRTLQVQDGGLQSSCGYEGGVEFDLHAYFEKLSEGENKGKFQCSLCGKISRDKYKAFTHVENIHFPGSYEHGCDQCGEKFDTKDKLSKHRSRVHYGKK